MDTLREQINKLNVDVPVPTGFPFEDAFQQHRAAVQDLFISKLAADFGDDIAVFVSEHLSSIEDMCMDEYTREYRALIVRNARLAVITLYQTNGASRDNGIADSMPFISRQPMKERWWVGYSGVNSFANLRTGAAERITIRYDMLRVLRPLCD